MTLGTSATSAIQALLIAIILVLAYLLFVYTRIREQFATGRVPLPDNTVIPQTNYTDSVLDRHMIENSVNIDYAVQNKNVYYYELGNEEFLVALNKTFQPNKLLLDGSQWSAANQINRTSIPSQEVIAQYKRVVPWIENTLNSPATTPYFAIPGDKPSPFQVVHDYWNTWSTSLFVKDRILIDLDVLVYREAKYHAKHINFKVVIEPDPSKNIIVTDVSIRGIVFEDHFGLFPVVHSDQTDLNNLYMPFNDDPLANYPTLIDEEFTRKEVERRDKQKSRMEKINKLYKQSKIL